MFVSTIEDYQFYADKITYWDNVYGFRMSCMKDMCDKEPIVDFIDSRSVNSNQAPILDINLKTVKVEELDFASSFNLHCNRDDMVSGVVSWFECFFSDCHVMERLDTSPHTKGTHWKQTLFYLDESVNVRKNQKISGHIAVRKNKKNPRELDVKLNVTTFDKSRKQHVGATKFYRMH